MAKRIKLLSAAFGLIAIVSVVTGLVLRARTRAEVTRLKTISGGSFPTQGASILEVDTALDYARSMVGIPYDLLMGRFGDPLGKVGLVVCIDVPVRSYQAAGISLPARLRSAAKNDPKLFSVGPNNPPSSPFFYRRVRNYHPLFQNDPLLEADSNPRVGDWAFYGKFHIALVSKVNQDGSFEVIEASPRKGRVSFSDGDYMEKTWGKPAFFGRIKRETNGSS